MFTLLEVPLTEKSNCHQYKKVSSAN